MGKLFFGDNLDVLRAEIADGSVDLIYLDPPFNSKRDYNLLFKSPKGQPSDAQVTAFEDTWQWGEQAEREYYELLHQPNTDAAEMIQALRRFLKESDLMAYLVMMANRLLELHRVLKPTGSLYLHCDPTASHYLKIVLDTVFGAENFRNEIVWKRTSSHNDPKRFGNIHDVILYYTKTGQFIWNLQYVQYDDEYIKRFRFTDPDGRKWTDDNLTAKGLSGGGYTYEYKGVTSLWRVPLGTMKRLDKEGRLYFTKSGGIRLKRYLDDRKGIPVQDVIIDISPINSQAAERLGYPTQKPLALLERIIQASSNPGDLVLDPFCGCGTAVHAAQKLGREWIGIDITHLAISLIEKRMRDAFPGIQFEVYGTPKDLDGARELARRDKYQFQWWACSLVNAQPYQGKKKGADSGIDGVIYFQDDETGAKKIIVSVKGGEHVSVGMVKDLIATVEREKAAIGLFVTLAEPTKALLTEAVSAGFYPSPKGDVPRIQVLTVGDLLTGKAKPQYYDLALGGHTFRKARVEKKRAVQDKLL
ncbi:MAG: site-specific DNA-methyltransferase [Anaerolineae bacterium]|nr:site-specific DNA-methyltransferase [Anaerolineae bacterium]